MTATDTAGAAAAGRCEGRSGVEPSPAVMLVARDAYVRNEAVSRAKIRVDWGSGGDFWAPWCSQPTRKPESTQETTTPYVRSRIERATGGQGRTAAEMARREAGQSWCGSGTMSFPNG